MRLRLSMRRMMIVTATLSVSLCMFIGIGNLVIYFNVAFYERNYRAEATVWEGKKESGLAESARQRADNQAMQKQQAVSGVMAPLALLGLGGIFAGILLVVRAKYGPFSSNRPASLNSLVAMCFAGTKIVFYGFIIAAIACVAVLLWVFFGWAD
jgi:hypothetical protein